MRKTCSGTINSNSFDTSHHAIIFIKDFAPNFSSFNITTIPVTPGPFVLTLNTDSGVGRHVQWGFAVTGPCVWFTDADLFGSTVISTVVSAGCPADFDGDGTVDFFDYDAFVVAFESPC